MKKSVWFVESTYDSQLVRSNFFNSITIWAVVAEFHSRNNSIDYKGKDWEVQNRKASVFKIFTDTTILIDVVRKDTLRFFPFTYDFKDIFGNNDWSHMFVSKLLKTNRGNCHSLPYLYKMICDELGLQCHLALAPNHIYIKHQAEKGGWYNTELTSATFPIDAWLMAS